jgi:hypothetical protein
MLSEEEKKIGGQREEVDPLEGAREREREGERESERGTACI